MLLLLLSCARPSPRPDVYPLDGELDLHHVQSKGTHNSYHVAPSDKAPTAWSYTRLPLYDQLALEGVRQFELDLWWEPELAAWRVYHVPVLDEQSTCDLFTDCLADLRWWSDLNPLHQPILVLLEIKQPFDPDTARDRLDDLEAELLSVWPPDRLVEPDMIRGTSPDLRTAIRDHGWPVLGLARGRAIFVLHDGGAWRDTYTEGGTTSAGRVLLPDAQGDLDLPIAAFHVVNDPVADAERIRAVIAAGGVLRTRADADGVEALAGDSTRLEAALASGAQFVSTDYPAPVEGIDYHVEIPGGTPSRCNPVTAPPGCRPEDVEDPSLVLP